VDGRVKPGHEGEAQPISELLGSATTSTYRYKSHGGSFHFQNLVTFSFFSAEIVIGCWFAPL
jgi:hypothetical protein